MLARVPVVHRHRSEHLRATSAAWHALAERLLMAAPMRVIASAESVRDFYVDQVHADPDGST